MRSHAPDVLPRDYPPITVRHLLTCTSGLPGPEVDHKDPPGATRYLSRRVEFSVNTLHMGGAEQPEITKRIIAAVSGLA